MRATSKFFYSNIKDECEEYRVGSLNSKFWLAAKKGHIDVCELMSKKGALYMEMCELMISNGANKTNVFFYSKHKKKNDIL